LEQFKEDYLEFKLEDEFFLPRGGGSFGQQYMRTKKPTVAHE
jgi:hypothetical protein